MLANVLDCAIMTCNDMVIKCNIYIISTFKKLLIIYILLIDIICIDKILPEITSNY